MQSERTNYRLSIAIGAACFLWMLNFLALTPFFPFVAKDLNTSVALLGQVTGLLALASIPVGMITGPLADRYGHRKVLLAGMSTLGIGSLITAIAPSYGVLMLMAPFGAVSQAIIRPLAVAIAGTHLAGDNRRGAVGLATIGMSIGTMAGIPMLTTIAYFGGWRASFGFLTALNVLVTVYLAWSIPPDAPASGDGSRSRLVLSAYSSLVADFPTMLLIVSSLVRSISLWGFNTYRGAFFVYRFGITSQQVGWIFTIAGMGLFLGGAVASSRFARLPLHWLAIVGHGSDRTRRRAGHGPPFGDPPGDSPDDLDLLRPWIQLGGHGYPYSKPGCRAAGNRHIVEPRLHQHWSCRRKLGRGPDDRVDGYPLLGITVLSFGAVALLLLWLSKSSGRTSSEPASGTS